MLAPLTRNNVTTRQRTTEASRYTLWRKLENDLECVYGEGISTSKYTSVSRLRVYSEVKKGAVAAVIHRTTGCTGTGSHAPRMPMACSERNRPQLNSLQLHVRAPFLSNFFTQEAEVAAKPATIECLSVEHMHAVGCFIISLRS